MAAIAPWRKVTAARRKAGHTGLGGVTTRKSRWWELTLDCGHTAERTVRYGPRTDGWPRQRGGTQHRSTADILPAPGRVRCERCPS